MALISKNIQIAKTDRINWFLEYPDIMEWSGDFLPDAKIIEK